MGMTEKKRTTRTKKTLNRRSACLFSTHTHAFCTSFCYDFVNFVVNMRMHFHYACTLYFLRKIGGAVSLYYRSLRVCALCLCTQPMCRVCALLRTASRILRATITEQVANDSFGYAAPKRGGCPGRWRVGRCATSPRTSGKRYVRIQYVRDMHACMHA
jgi:hypothetical protein